jgi:hypothetical protein
MGSGEVDKVGEITVVMHSLKPYGERHILVFAFFLFYLTPLPPRVLVLHVGAREGPTGFVEA